MEKFIPYNKLSKKEKRKINSQKRKSWKELSPITRSEKNPKVYNRRNSRKIDDDFTGVYFCPFAIFYFDSLLPLWRPLQPLNG